MSLNKLNIYFLLFRFSFSISAFTFGGGYVVVPMMRKYFVDELELISEEELLDMASIAQSTPGAIAVNIAVLVGYRISGLKGAIVTCIGTISPPLIILSVVSLFYQSFRANTVVSSILKGMEAGVAATIVDLLVDMWQSILKEKNLLLTLMAPFAFLTHFIFNVNVLYIIVFSALLCSAQAVLENKFLGVKK